jgi:small subunit ribosomal protein S20
MANKKTMRHASALKALRQARVETENNRQTRSAIRTAALRVIEAVAAKKADQAKERLVQAASAWSRAAHRGVIHSNTASRKIGRLSKLVHSLAK